MARRRIHLSPLILLPLAGLLAAFGAMPTVNPGPEPAPIQAVEPATTGLTSPAPLGEWRVLVLAYSEMTVTWPESSCAPAGAQHVTDESPSRNGSSDAYVAALAVAHRLPAVVDNWSSGRVALNATFVEVHHPITKLSFIGDCFIWPGPQDISADLAEFAPEGRYDGIFVVWPDASAFHSKAWGLTTGPNDATHGAAFTAVSEETAAMWSSASEPAETYVHELLHQIIITATDRGMNGLPDLHRAEAFGYSSDSAVVGSSKAWYSDYLSGQINQNDIGLTNEVWGRIRSVPVPSPTESAAPSDPCAERISHAGPKALGRRLHDFVVSQPRTLFLADDHSVATDETFDACGFVVDAPTVALAGPTTVIVDAEGTIGTTAAYRVATGPLAGRWMYADWLTFAQPSPTIEATASPAPTARPTAQPTTAANPTSISKAAPVYRGRSHIWIPSLGLSKEVSVWGCKSGTLPNRVYQWTCAGKNNLDLLGHAWGVFAPIHDFYLAHKRMPRNAYLMYADASGTVRRYDLAWTKVVNEDSLQNGKDQGIIYDDLTRPSITLETCIGRNNVNRLVTRWVLLR